MIITQETIAKVKKVSTALFDDEEAEKIMLLHKELLLISMENNNSDEVGMLVNLMDWSKIVIYGIENGISLRKVPQAMNLVCTAPKNSLLFLHNHPRNSVFSRTDLESFLATDSILTLTVVCNNGVQYFLTKMARFDKYEALVYYDTVHEMFTSGVIKEFLKTCGRVGLEFNYGGV